VRQIVLLRGINLPKRNRVSMPQLRDALSRAGFEDVRTYLQSGNVVLASDSKPDALADDVKRLIASALGLDIRVLVRTRDELAEVIARNPLAGVASDPRRYQVTFLSRELDTSAVKELAGLATGGEELRALGRELYAWHPDGVGRSQLALRLASAKLPVVATARNWATVTALLGLADE
jgi:uncharacterized protein (DUF1697 family)